MTETAVADHEIHDAHDDAHDPHATNTGISNNKLGMWVFLGSECLLFGGLISSYLIYKNRPGVKGVAGDPRRIADLFEPAFTSASSFILLVSSLTMVLALSAIKRGDQERFRVWVTVTALAGGTFLAGQIYEFTHFVNEGLGFTSNVGSSAFFALTGFHGAHVAIGIIMLLSTLFLNIKGRLTPDKAESVEIVGLYWHFVDIVWVLIFTIVYLIP